MRLPALMVLMVAALAAAPPKKAQPAEYTPDPKTWKLLVTAPSGGWTTGSDVSLRFKVVDPKDPDPPKDDTPAYVDSDGEGDGEGEGDGSGPDLNRSRPWRQRSLTYWWNGEKQTCPFQVGYSYEINLKLANGENRLELWQPDSNQRMVRSLWGTATGNRLVVRMIRETEVKNDYGWWRFGLQIVEPDHTESIGWEPTPSGGRNEGQRYVHLNPLPGTYTVRVFDQQQGVEGYEWGSGSEGGEARPRKVIVEVFLDPGTERERRWRFERLMMPGTRRATLGSFDIED